MKLTRRAFLGSGSSLGATLGLRSFTVAQPATPGASYRFFTAEEGGLRGGERRPSDPA